MSSGGEGNVAEVDGACFGGYVTTANKIENRVDRRLAENQSGKRKVVIRERAGETLPAVLKTGAVATAFTKTCVRPGTVVNADDASSWDRLHARYEMKRINHSDINWAEEYFSRLRRGEMGHYHHISGPYLLRYAQEAAWREYARRVANCEHVQRVAELALHSKASVDFTAYWQRHKCA